ncbi:flavodoxin domain-containing protein [Curvibacter sp. HBC61]|uniref:Flavodoxin domain-containing protein n=1 Tax=Curvibacter cyanobacteriorum TaxID=3026422 RepID=A0ABT5MXS3_9BURK|nr:flavodoxin domain-containing protein [Curvibacter sp. HBC61]MDD0838086.1 flavodoxin domain-containing protein [Curvibacter sp. HBC61]
MKLKILVGTMTSTADYVAQAIQMDCADLVESIDITLMDGLDSSVFNDDALYLICTSTYGTGDVPDNAQDLYDALNTPGLALPGLRYGVIALGDSQYAQTFCFGGQRFDERLSALGAQRLGDVWRHDASSGIDPEGPATAWCRDWLAQALACS